MNIDGDAPESAGIRAAPLASMEPSMNIDGDELERLNVLRVYVWLQLSRR